TATATATATPTPAEPASDYVSTIKREAGLVAYWRLDEPGGATAGDGSGQGHDGAYQGVLLGQPGALAGGGDADAAATFPDGGSYMDTTLDVGPAALPTTTWEAWVYPTATGDGRQLF